MYHEQKGGGVGVGEKTSLRSRPGKKVIYYNIGPPRVGLPGKKETPLRDRKKGEKEKDLCDEFTYY